MSKRIRDEYRLSNKKIKENVCDALAQAPNVNCSEIKVSVDDGVVTLKGKVDERRMKRMVKEWIETVAGVNDVQNELHVDSSKRGHEKSGQSRQSNKVSKKRNEQNL